MDDILIDSEYVQVEESLQNDDSYIPVEEEVTNYGSSNSFSVVSVSDNDAIDDISDTETVSINSVIPENTVINNTYNLYVSSNDVSYNAVSSSIIDKPLSDYTVQESLSFFSITLFLVVGLIIVIHKGVFRWN